MERKPMREKHSNNKDCKCYGTSKSPTEMLADAFTFRLEHCQT